MFRKSFHLYLRPPYLPERIKLKPFIKGHVVKCFRYLRLNVRLFKTAGAQFLLSHKTRNQ